MNKKLAFIASNGGLFDANKVFNVATAADVTLTFLFEIFYTNLYRGGYFE